MVNRKLSFVALMLFKKEKEKRCTTLLSVVLWRLVENWTKNSLLQFKSFKLRSFWSKKGTVLTIIFVYDLLLMVEDCNIGWVKKHMAALENNDLKTFSGCWNKNFIVPFFCKSSFDVSEANSLIEEFLLPASLCSCSCGVMLTGVRLCAVVEVSFGVAALQSCS